MTDDADSTAPDLNRLEKGGRARSVFDEDATQLIPARPSGPAPADEQTRVLPRTAPLDQPPSQGFGGDKTLVLPRSAFGIPPPPTEVPFAGDETRILPASALPQAAGEPPTLRVNPQPPPEMGQQTQQQTSPAFREANKPSDAARTLPGPAQSAPTTLPGRHDEDAGDLRRVGRYQIIERIGRGGMATVFKAHDPGIGRDVAIKFLHPSLSEDEGCRVRFLREAGAAGRLSHPNIAVVHDVGEIDRRPFMTMELLTGQSLADELDEKHTLPVRESVTVGIELARALDFAHSKGIVHRDIKPGNILRMSDSRTIKVTDFGIAHIDNPSDDSTDRTRFGDILGTPQYMSPEQARGDRIDGRSDLFSAGIVLYQMLTGERPFRGDNLVAVVAKIANEDPPPIDKVRPGVPASLRRVVERCLSKQPDKRFQTGAELAGALTKVLTELDEAEAAKLRPRIVPLRVKWAATMALIVAVVMGITATVITQRQVDAMMNQVSDYGASLARFIAAQNAAAVLGEDWESVEVSVQEIMKTRNFERVVVVDLGGIVRVSSVPGMVAGTPHKPPEAETLAKLGGSTATRYIVNGESVLGFESPITFHDKQVGRVALGIPEKPLTQVARLSITLMIILAVVTVLAVAIAMYFVADWFAKPIRLLGESMAEIAKGRYDHRIAEKRKDEFGQLYEIFDAMAGSLQQLHPASGGGDAGARLTMQSGQPVTQMQTVAAASSPGNGDSSPKSPSGA